MPHNLYRDPSTGQTSMMFTGDLPWHRLGQKLENPPTSAEAIQAAGLNWQVEKYPLQVKTPLGYQTIKDQYVVMRADLWERGVSEPYFGIVSSEYIAP